jgi:hypothetical protein
VNWRFLKIKGTSKMILTMVAHCFRPSWRRVNASPSKTPKIKKLSSLWNEMCYPITCLTPLSFRLKQKTKKGKTDRKWRLSIHKGCARLLNKRKEENLHLSLIF